MPVHPGWIWSASQVPPPPLQVLGEASDGGSGGRVLRRNLTQIDRCHSGQPTIAHHLQIVGGRGGLPLVILGGGTGGGSNEDREAAHRRRGGQYVNYNTDDGGQSRGMQG